MSLAQRLGLAIFALTVGVLLALGSACVKPGASPKSAASSHVSVRRWCRYATSSAGRDHTAARADAARCASTIRSSTARCRPAFRRPGCAAACSDRACAYPSSPRRSPSTNWWSSPLPAQILGAAGPRAARAQLFRARRARGSPSRHAREAQSADGGLGWRAACIKRGKRSGRPRDPSSGWVCTPRATWPACSRASARARASS